MSYPTPVADVRLISYVTPDEYQQIKDQASDERRSISKLVRAVVTSYVDGHTR